MTENRTSNQHRIGRIGWLLSAAAVAMLLVLGEYEPARAQDDGPRPVRIIEQDDHSVVLELTVGSYQIETVSQDGQEAHRVQIPGLVPLEIPGKPVVPVYGTLIGLPVRQGVSLEIRGSEFATFSGYRLLPSPIRVADSGLDLSVPSALRLQPWQDESIYATDAFYPQVVAQLGDIALIRDQPVVPIQFFPVQYNPVTTELRIYRTITVAVVWDMALSAAGPSVTQTDTSTEAYSSLLRATLLNASAQPTEGHVQKEQTGAMDVAPSLSLAENTLESPILKIGVEEDGLYRVSYQELTQTGIAVAEIDPRRISLHNRGRTIPIYIAGEADGSFDESDYILFYGTAITDVYTSRNVYWLTVGNNNGLRMEQRDGSPSDGEPMPADFAATVHAEVDTAYWQQMPNGAGQDHWFWGTRLSPNTNGLPPSRMYTVPLANIANSATPARMRVRLKGYTQLEHRTKVFLNGTEIDDQSWSGQTEYTQTVTFDHALLKNGNNQVLIQAVDSGAEVDQILVNWIEIDYRDTYVAEHDQLEFGAPNAGQQQFEISGFSSADVVGLDITEPEVPVFIANVETVVQGQQYRARFRASPSATTSYVASTTAHARQPASIEVDQPSDWMSTAHGADYLLITYDTFYTATLRLAEHRANQGLRVAVVKIQDIYDEFNDGIFNPAAIRSFISYAYSQWVKPAPLYVVLVGDASQDYKDNLGEGFANFVPTQIIESASFGQVPSDNWFVTVSGDDPLPDLLVGRLAVQSAQQTEEVIDKLIRYDQSAADEPWNRHLVVVADNEDPAFEEISESIVEIVPFNYSTERIYAKSYPPGNPTDAVRSAFNQGTVLLNYVGHGDTLAWGTWNNTRIFQGDDVATLTNGEKLAVVIVADCLNGFFASTKNFYSMAERLQTQPGGGAVAVWAPSTLNFPVAQQVLLDALYDAVFNYDQTRLGLAASTALARTFAYSLFWRELVETYVLFGDPFTAVRIPAGYPYVEQTMPPDHAVDVALDAEVKIVFNRPMDPDRVDVAASGSAQLSFTPAWNEDHTQLTLVHDDLEPEQTYEITIQQGSDHLGISIGTGPVPATWSFTSGAGTPAKISLSLPLLLK